MRIRDLYRVETLDIRFAGTGQPLATAQPSKWRSTEFIPYYITFLTIVPVMFKSVYDVSVPSHPSYEQYEKLLEPGWIPGRKVDNSDSQYAGFRENIPYLGLVLILHPFLRKLYESVCGEKSTEHANASTTPSESASSTRADARLHSRIRFDLAFAIVFTIVLHGVSASKVFAILYLNYQIATALPRQYVAVSTWLFNIGVLFANELCHGYRFADIAAVTLPPTEKAAGKPVGDNWGSRIDGYGGLIPRWEILFNITVLRLIAFNFDHLWMLDRRASSPIEVSTGTVLSSGLLC